MSRDRSEAPSRIEEIADLLLAAHALADESRDILLKKMIETALLRAARLLKSSQKPDKPPKVVPQ